MVVQKRLEICKDCQFYNNLRCSKDDSNLLLKIRIANSICPENKWPITNYIDNQIEFLEDFKNKRLLNDKTNIEDIIWLAENQSSGGWNGDFYKLNNVEEAFRELGKRTSNKILELRYPEERCSGRGIVTCGGGPKYFPSIYVNIRILRMLGCTLPIEVWYIGQDEMDFHQISLLEEVPGVKCIDETACNYISPIRPDSSNKKYRGWQSKVYSIINSSFEEVLFLDADNTALVNPEFLFDEPAYLEHGAVLWPDFACWHHDEVMWRIMGIPYIQELQIESGQALINKRKSWKEINMAKYYCDYSDYYFKRFFGDKEAFHFGWRFWGADYGLPPKPLWHNASVIIQHKFDGSWLFSHRTGAKMRIDRKHRISYDIPYEKDTLKLLEELEGRIGKGLWTNSKPSEEEISLTKNLEGLYKYNRVNLDIRDVKFGNNNKIVVGGARMEKEWYCFIRPDGNYISIVGDEGLTCLLKQDGDVWSGKWISHEMCEVKLTPYGI